MSESSTRSSSQQRSIEEKVYDRGLEAGMPSETVARADDYSKPTAVIRRHFNAELSPRGADLILLLCWFTTGFLDSTIFQAYRTFVSMQTGNTVFIALGATASAIDQRNTNFRLSVRPYGWLKSLLSLLAFVLGSLFFSRLGRFLGGTPSRRLTLTVSFALQMLLILLSAILVQTSTIESRLEYVDEDIDWLHLVPITLLSFQAPAQVACGRAMGLWEVPTVVVTTMVYDFASDGALFTGLTENASRNRRAAGWCSLLIGALAGGWITVYTRHISVTLWVASAIKAAITLAWVGWPAKGQEVEGDAGC